MRKILYSSPHIPRPWIAAHGMNPVLSIPSGSKEHPCAARVEGLCAYMQAWIGEALADNSADAIVLARTCDQTRRIFEILRQNARVPCFLFNIPATWQTAQARQLYKDELKRLSRFLVEAGGCEPSDAVLSEKMTFHEERPLPGKEGTFKNKINLALTGPHGSAEDAVWLDIIKQKGGMIAFDGTQPTAPFFDRRALAARPFEELADSFFDSIQDIFQRPNSGFYQKLAKSLKEAPFQGLIVRRYLWCDLWHAEVYRLKQWSPIPVLDLEISAHPREDRHRLATRIESFLEMVS